MTTSTSIPRVSKRIQAIADLYENEPIVWDLCCDHGHIGALIDQHHKLEWLYFVDQAAGIMKKLKDSYIPRSRYYKFLVNSIGHLNIKSHSKNQLFILAGIGGNLAVTFLRRWKYLQQKNPQLINECRFILCVHSKVTALREYLVADAFSLEYEFLLKERNKYYEILKVSYRQNQSKVHRFGKEMWRSLDSEALEYRNHLLRTLKKRRNCRKSQEHIFYLESLC